MISPIAEGMPKVSVADTGVFFPSFLFFLALPLHVTKKGINVL